MNKNTMEKMEKADKKNKLVFYFVAALSTIVFMVVVMLNRRVIPRPEGFIPPSWAYYLPTLNASINALCSVLLILSFYFIKRKKVAIHKALNLTCFVLSCIFLISYIGYHYMCTHTEFPTNNPLKQLYYFVLTSHIVLSALVLPMVLLTFYYGLTNNVVRHRKIARWSFPIWLYVTITGVVVYLMISPHYHHPN